MLRPALLLPLLIPLTALGADSAGLPAGAMRVAEARVAAARFSPRTAQWAAALAAAIPVRAPEAITALCRDADALTAGAALSRWLDRVERAAAGAAEQLALRTLAACPERVFLRHPETSGDWWVPAFGNALRAQGLLAGAARVEAVQQLAHALRADDPAKAWSAQPPEAASAAAAVALLTPAERARLASRAALPATVQLALAAAGEPRLIASALAQAPEEALLPVLPGLFAALPAQERQQALAITLGRPQLVSAAILQTRQWPEEDWLQAWWLQRLEESRHAASVAQLLSERWTPDRIAAALSQARSEQARTHLALALRLSVAPEAAALLQAAARAGELPRHVAAELLR